MTIPEISEHEGMSQPHVAKIMAVLKKFDYVKSVRGQVGGYSLKIQAKDIVIGNLLNDLGGRLFGPDFCSRHNGTEDECVHLSSECALRHLWSRVQFAVDEVTFKITLQDLIDSPSEPNLMPTSNVQFRRSAEQ